MLACAVLCAKFYFAMRASQDEQTEWEQAKEAETETSGRLGVQMSATEKEKDRAEEVLAWLNGSRSLQPINMVISRSVSDKSSIQELSLIRKEEDPSQLAIRMKLSGDTAKQMVATLQALKDFNYRPYFEQRKSTEEILDYEATLIRN
jgi:hypothetical protein